MTEKKILLLSVSAGHGHVRAADALAAGAELWFPHCATRHVDLMSLVPALFRKTYKDAYIKLVQSQPALWGYIYSKTDQARAGSALSRMRRGLESACVKKLRAVIDEFKPDHIVCTHFLPLQVLARWRAKGRLDTPVWTCITDFASHGFWMEPGQAGYFTATEEDAWRLRRRGMAGDNIRATGIPVLPQFIPPADAVAARKDAARAFALDPGKTTVLLMGGGAGVGGLEETAMELLQLPADFQLVALAGKNQALLANLEDRAKDFPGRFAPLGFTNEVHKLLAAADLVVSKPGGLTTVECLAMGKPMVALAPIPGQEERNADFLLENGAALRAFDGHGLIWRVKRLLDDPERLRRLAEAAAFLGKPYSARDVLSEVLGEAPRA